MVVYNLDLFMAAYEAVIRHQSSENRTGSQLSPSTLMHKAMHSMWLGSRAFSCNCTVCGSVRAHSLVIAL